MYPTHKQVEGMKKRYSKGSRVELIKMDDPYAPPKGTQGTVTGVDDMGSVLVHWDNGSTLNAVYGEDVVRIIKPDFELVFQNGKREGFESFDEAWQYVTDMVMNHDLVWVDLEAKNADTIHIRKGL
ncbi:DUF4314 domain-containing protein [Lactococcus lactis]|uniref:DUF4314 domain-containing protein n=1 Tax=Lactococcus lactis subsp. lactis A12 TaxID=1137134 RepID=S6F5Z8_LACLL|nr:DUF4314 domain-containing protein [Lactococcus lactis]CDG04239.1 Putative uncharacterized protein [Lactococcus lactis subsp. lactis A12]SBW30148.1 Putative uncharacterized protein [Lactococcus lactis subsp. lactis]